MKSTVSTGAPNLRGAYVGFVLGNRRYYGKVITHLRDNLWRVRCDDLPARHRRPDGTSRITLHREALTIIWGADQDLFP